MHRRQFLGIVPAGMAAASGAGLARTVAARKLRAGWIGVGGRGTGLLANALSLIADLEVPAICDINPAAAARGAEMVRQAGRGEPELYTDGERAWEKLLGRGDLDVVVIATPWRWHTPMACGAMAERVIPGVEVPCALSLDECWQLVETSERTGVPCMMLENWSFRSDNLALLNMVRGGLFGEIVHVHAAHSHDCIDHWFFDATTGADRWSAEYLIRYNRDQYPTHGIGPVLSWCDIHCGDRFVSIASAATASRGINDYFTRKFGSDHPGAQRVYAQGDIVTSVLRTARGKTVVLNYDMQLPRPYDNRWMLQGTLGVYREATESLYLEGRSPQYHDWEPFAAYHESYRHALWKEGGQGGHGGVDGVMLRAFFDGVRQGGPLPLSLEDSVAMSAIIELSGRSIAEGGIPIEFPDFTRGRWETATTRFAVDPAFAGLPGG